MATRESALALVVAAVAQIYNSVTLEETNAGAPASEAFSVGLSRSSLLLAICSGLGVALALLMARRQQARPRAVDLAATAVAATSHAIPTRANPWVMRRRGLAGVGRP